MSLFRKIIQMRKDNNAMKMYGEYYRSKTNVFKKMLNYYKYRKNYSIAIWGAGYKGKAFLKIVDSKNKLIKYVYDIDESKQGEKLITGHKIVNYLNKANQDIQVVFIMNSTFETEIAGLLKEAGLHVILVNVDSIICGNLTAKEAIEMYREKV